MEYPHISSLSGSDKKEKENYNSKRTSSSTIFVSPYFSHNHTDNNNVVVLPKRNNNVIVLPKRKNTEKEKENDNSKKTSSSIRVVSPYFSHNHTDNNKVVVLPKRNNNVIVLPKRKNNEKEKENDNSKKTSSSIRVLSPYFSHNHTDNNNVVVLPKRNNNVIVPPRRKNNKNRTGTSSSTIKLLSPYFDNSNKNKNDIVVDKKIDKKRKKLLPCEMFKDAYKRRTPDNTWKPPESPHELLQEEHAFDPWRVLVICTLLNVTTGQQVRSVLSSLFNLCPNAKYCTQVPTAAIEHVIVNLGLQKKRSIMLKRLSEEYLDGSWTHVTQLHGVGKYAADAYAIFCTGKWDQVTPSDKKLNLYWDWLRSREHT